MAAGYKKRKRIMVTGEKAFMEIMDYLSDHKIEGHAVGLVREDEKKGDPIYWICFKSDLPTFGYLRGLAKGTGELIATTGYGH